MLDKFFRATEEARKEIDAERKRKRLVEYDAICDQVGKDDTDRERLKTLFRQRDSLWDMAQEMDDSKRRGNIVERTMLSASASMLNRELREVDRVIINREHERLRRQRQRMG